PTAPMPTWVFAALTLEVSCKVRAQPRGGGKDTGRPRLFEFRTTGRLGGYLRLGGDHRRPRPRPRLFPGPTFDHVSWRAPHIPDQPDLLEGKQDVVAHVHLPPAEPLVRRRHVVVVVVVPSLAHGDEREQPVVARVVGGLVAAAAEHVRQRVDGEG